MFGQIAKTNRRVADVLRRILIVDQEPARARVLGELLQDACRPQVWHAASAAKAFKLAAKVEPDLIICEFAAEAVDGLAFTRGLRRSDLPCRKTPVILVMTQPTATAILAGRDAGAHEFLRRPFTLKDVTRRLEAVALYPRNWVEAVDYVGPDRRRFNSAEHEGDLKRVADASAPPHAVRVGEALKILASALSAIDRQPAQALRSLLAQAEDLAEVAAETADQGLAAASQDLRRYLETTGRDGSLNAIEVRRRAAALVNQASIATPRAKAAAR